MKAEVVAACPADEGRKMSRASSRDVIGGDGRRVRTRIHELEVRLVLRKGSPDESLAGSKPEVARSHRSDAI